MAFTDDLALFALRKKGDAWVSPPFQLSVRNETLRFLSVGESFTYLGLTYTLARGFSNLQHLRTLTDSVSRVKRLALKPQQKVILIKQYIIQIFLS